MPLSRPRSFSAASSVAGDSALPFERDRIALLELERDLGDRVRRVHRRDGALVDEFRRLQPRILQHLALGGRVQKVGVDRERRFALLVLRHRDLVLLGEVQQVGARLERPVAPRRDDLDVGVQRIGGQLEADLVVALAGRAVRDGVGAGFAGDVDQMLGDQRPGDRGAEQIVPFIDGIGAEHRKDEIARRTPRARPRRGCP